MNNASNTTLKNLAKVIRSKNSGPFELTFDVIFADPAVYEHVKASGVLTRTESSFENEQFEELRRASSPGGEPAADHGPLDPRIRRNTVPLGTRVGRAQAPRMPRGWPACARDRGQG